MTESAASLSLSLDRSSPLKAYEQIQLQLRSLIQAGRLPAGTRLPSTRDLAISLGVSRTTTIKSYDVLISEGFLVAKPKQGAFVADHLPSIQLAQNRATAEFPSSLPEWFFDSGPDVNQFPNKEWAASLRRSWLKPDLELMKGRYLSGFPGLKQALASYLNSLRGLQVTQEQILITAGNRDALSILAHALLSTEYEARQVWLENPCYEPVPTLFSWLGKAVGGLQMDAEGACLPPEDEALNCGSSLAVLTPNRQYPLGLTMSPQRRQDWLNHQAKLAEQGHKLWLIEDDYDNEFLYQGRTNAPLMNLDQAGGIFFVGSFSKVLFRGIRLGFIVAPKDKVDLLKASQRYLGSSSSMAIQPAVADFMNTGAFATHLRRMRRLYLQKRDWLDVCLQRYLSRWLIWEKPGGGMHIVTRLRPEYLPSDFDGNVDEEVAAISLDKGLSLMTLSTMYFAGEKQQGFILGFTGMDNHGLEQSCQILESSLELFFTTNLIVR